MWFVLRALAVIAVIAFLSPYRGGAERETTRLAEEVPTRALAQVPPDMAERAILTGAALVARGVPHDAAGALRGALAPAR